MSPSSPPSPPRDPAETWRDLKEGEVLDDRYRVERRIGEGGMGIVFEVTELATGTRLALKTLRRDQAFDRTQVERFAREAAIVGRIRHPNVVQVHDIGRSPSGEARYLVMELLRGTDLGDRLPRGQGITVEAAVEVMAQVTEGLAAAHEAGVVHRDLKPENVFVVDRDDGPPLVKVVDFGVARQLDRSTRLTEQGALVGSPSTMSPELLSGLDVDPRADLWAVGVMLYRALTGRQPFRASSVPQSLVKIVRGDYAPLGPVLWRDGSIEESPHLSAVVDRCLRTDRSQRYQSASELIGALREIPCGRPSRLRLTLTERRALERAAAESTTAGSSVRRRGR